MAACNKRLNIDDMGDTKKLKQENSKLKNQVQALSEEVEQMKSLLQQTSIQLASEPPTDATVSLNREDKKSLSFLSDKYDELILFKSNALKELERLGKKIEDVSEKVNNISEAIDNMESYSYQYNIKLVGFPELHEHESAIETTNLCLEIFKAIGVSGITSHDIDIAHRVKSRRDFGPKPIICKFVRRLAKENVMNRRREVESVHPSILGYDSETSLAQAKIYDHLTPRLQHLLSEANKFKIAHHFHYCWAKNGQVLLRKSHESRVIKLRSIEDLISFTNNLEPE